MDFKMSLRLHVALFFLLPVIPLVTHGVMQSPGCSDWKVPDSNNNIIPNFSRVGYRQGHVKIPLFPVKKILEPSPDQFSDDTGRIQKALDDVGDLPLAPLGRDDIMFRGAVLLKKGVYRVARTLIINQSGVILRGEGRDLSSGTIILGIGLSMSDMILIDAGIKSRYKRLNMGMEYDLLENDYQPPPKPRTQIRRGVYVSVGTTNLPVDDTAGFKVDDRIVIELRGSKEWIQHIGMDALWDLDMFTFRFERTIVDVDQSERTLTIDNPMVMNIDPQHPLRAAKIYRLAHRIPMISDVGVENLRLSKQLSVFQKDTMHAVQINNTIHGWVSDVSTDGFMLGIEVSEFASFITIQNCKVNCRGRGWHTPVEKRTGFALNGQMSLVNNCTAISAFHDFTSTGPVCGPNVFVGSSGTNSLGPTGPRKLWVMGSLYDNIASGNFSVLNQRPSRSQSALTTPGWTGAFNVFYNCKAEGRYNKFESAPGTTNWIIGFQGLSEDYFTWWKESKIVCPNSNVEPPSLYWSQLAERTGKSTDELIRMNGADFRDYSTAEDAGNTPTTTQVGTRRPSTFRRICRHIGKRLSQ